MPRIPKWVVQTAIILLLGPVCLAVRQAAGGLSRHGSLHALPPESVRMAGLPRQVLWAWERPEDLRTIDPKTTAVAYLDQTIRIGYEPGKHTGAGPLVTAVQRHSPLAFPNSTKLLAVVRVEINSTRRLSPAELKGATGHTVELLRNSANEPGIAAFEVDFDALRSQREFYAEVLRQLRRQMPPALPLTMTALASWCSYDDWIGDLPVDEAVPMLFRMEPDRRGNAGKPELQIREPKCLGSVGVSTHEPWPEEIEGRRMYVFPDRGWKNDLAGLQQRGER